VNRRQRALLIESILVVAATTAAVIGMIHLKDHVNRSEAVRAMEGLGKLVLEYRKEHGSLPPQSYVDSVKGGVEGAVRMGNVRYRALYIGMDAPGDTILAYSEKRHRSSLLKDGLVVLRLNGTVEWMPTADFTRLFAQQRAPAEPNLPKK
jgi:hypothetical protein